MQKQALYSADQRFRREKVVIGKWQKTLSVLRRSGFGIDVPYSAAFRTVIDNVVGMMFARAALGLDRRVRQRLKMRIAFGAVHLLSFPKAL